MLDKRIPPPPAGADATKVLTAIGTWVTIGTVGSPSEETDVGIDCGTFSDPAVDIEVGGV